MIQWTRLLTIALIILSSCKKEQEVVRLNGAGATFPYPLYSRWLAEYRQIDTMTEINYQSIGSGGGIRQFMDKTVDFGATDSPVKDDQIQQFKEAFHHIPTALGAVVITYNLPQINTALKFTPEVLSEIFLGTINSWTDPKIKALNPDVNFPSDLPLLVVYRSDGSGTSGIFTDYLSKVSNPWKTSVGQGNSVSWPVGIGGKGNEGVTGIIKKTPGSIGYVEFIYAENNQMPMAAIQNSSQNFIAPSTKAMSSAAESNIAQLPEDLRISITNSSQAESYPIAGLTYLLVLQKQEKTKGEALQKFLIWALTDGQKINESLSYAALPSIIQEKALAKVKQLEFQ